MLNAPCQILDWDTSFFGFRIARIGANHLRPSDMAAIDDWCEREKVRCLYLLAASNNIQTTMLAEGHGFHLVDIRITLQRQVKPPYGHASHVRPVRPDDIAALSAIASTSHTDSRFYQDHGFPRSRCDEFYRTWIERSCKGWAQFVFVFDRDDRPSGYITCHHDGENGQIGLMAVADWARGQRIASSLVETAISAFAEIGVRESTVVTQGRNISALRLYQKCGFAIRSVELWYHRWFERSDLHNQLR